MQVKIPLNFGPKIQLHLIENTVVCLNLLSWTFLKTSAASLIKHALFRMFAWLINFSVNRHQN